MARRAVNVLLTTIQGDLDAVEEETGDVTTVVSESWITDMKEFCSKIEKMISVDFKEASEKLARLDKHRTTGAAVGMSQNMVDYTRRLRAVQSDIRKLNSSRSSTPSTVASVETVSTGDSGRGYKAYMERLKTPSFSGKVEEWPEFRSVWTALMSDLPDSVQIQHIKSSLPASDSKRVAGLKTMAEVWTRLETVYGDTDLNIITVKSNLESLVPKAVLEHKRIIEVYEAVESAKTQLDNLGALNYLKEDFGLINKLILKLPQVEQRHYSKYITSATVTADLTTSRWDKFWTWLTDLHKSAVQAGLMHLCDRTSANKASGIGSRSGVTCHNCGGSGHLARSCPSKLKSGSSPQVKVNIAVSKITSRGEYDKYLADTKKQVGDCPACKQGPHSYTQNFPFGKAEWPSNRLDSCPKFVSMTPKERGELVEKIKACYKCTCFKH